MNIKHLSSILIFFSALVVLAFQGACHKGEGQAVIFISLDTLRPDHLGCYGYGRETSPWIDRFAQEDAVLFEAAYCQAPLTLPSHMSMLTGLYPEAHGVLLPSLGEVDAADMDRLGGKVTTLAEAFKARGYKTSGFTDGLLVAGKYGFEQGFDEYRDERGTHPDPNGFRRFGAALHRWIKKNVDSDFFLFIHTYDTHSPYDAPEPFRSQFKGKPPARELPSASMQFCSLLGTHDSLNLIQYRDLQDVVDRYDGCIAYVDHEVGRLFELLKKLGIWEKALVVVTSDHGESFMENDLMIGHGLCMNNEETLIPLLIKLPGSLHAGRRVSQIVESIDIMPTLLSSMQLSIPAEVQGQNLLHGLKEGRWKKSFAYGSSPNTGNNHYLLRDGIKFIGAVEDPDHRLLKGHLMPNNPPSCIQPPKPYYAWAGRAYFYDFDEDPLGIFELFHQGDRAYQLKEAGYEWKAEEILDNEILMEFKKTAHRIAEQSKVLGQKFKEEGEQQITLSAEELEQLNALGYGGIIAAADLGSKGSDEGQVSSQALKITPPTVDRSLLNQGDKFLWEINRYFQKQDTNLTYKEFKSKLEKARSCFERFRALHPEKENWIKWRLKCLDLAAQLRAQ